MVSAFFSAMFSFSKNLAGKALDLLRVGDRQFVVKESPDLLFIALIDLNDNMIEVIERLDKLQDFFYKKYANLFTNKSFDGNLEPFYGMESYIDELISNPPISKKTSAILETLEEIKKLVNTRKKGTKIKLNELLDKKINEAKNKS